MGRKEKIRLFVSYARANKNLADKFMKRYKEQVEASKNYEYVFWWDENILVGEAWHAGIAQALQKCNLGLILISPALLGSRYISEHELPNFVGNAPKPLIPVMLQSVDFERMDLKGLKKYQIFRLEGEKFKAPKSYGDCTGNQRDRFVQMLFGNVEKRLDALFGRKGSEKRKLKK
ncbi:MAG: toll/interleukin-1 receptor domain-containing protein [Deltaproteobacteria bacterium]|nr:toll/interleukin-1 receptor domain-containing protein [Deltaproteobacteria bacterium]